MHTVQIRGIRASPVAYEHITEDGSQGRMSTSPHLQTVERIVDKYDLETVGEELVALHDGEDPVGVRDLALHFNTEVTDAALQEMGISLDRDAVTAIVEQLTADDDTDTKVDVAGQTVDLSEVSHDLITHEYLPAYMRSLWAKTETPEQHPADVIDAIQTDHDRMARADKRRLATLSAHGELDGVTPRVTVEATATCRTCHTETDLLTYLRNGGCPVPDCAGEDARTI